MRTIRALSVISAFTLVCAAFSPAYSLDDLPSIERPTSNVEEELARQFEPIMQQGGELQELIEDTTLLFQKIADEDPTESERAINEYFSVVRGQMDAILHSTAENSDLRNALSRARERTLVLRDDLERRVARGAARQSDLDRLDEAVARFDIQRDELEQRRARANETIYDLSRQQDEVLDSIRLNSIESAQDSLNEVMNRLTEMSDGIENLQGQSISFIEN